MSQEATVNASLAFAKAQVQSKQLALSANTRFDVTGTRYAEGVMNVPTTAGGTVIPLGPLAGATLGLAMFKNVDLTNYVDLMSVISTGEAFCRLMPGECALFRIGPGITAPAALAHTAIVPMEFLILEA